MKNLSLIILVSIWIVSCNNETEKAQSSEINGASQLEMAAVREDNFDLRNDSVIFNSGTIENFDKEGRSIDIYWIGEARDTILRFYRKYDENKKLIDFSC